MITIRKAQSADLAFMKTALHELNALHHQAKPDEFMPPEQIEAKKDLSVYVSRERCFAFIAEAGLQPVGFIAGHVRQLESLISPAVPMGSIDEVFVAESMRSQGVGAMLYQAFEDECRQQGATDMFVEIWEFNTRAHKFYESHGLSTQIRWAHKKL